MKKHQLITIFSLVIALSLCIGQTRAKTTRKNLKKAIITNIDNFTLTAAKNNRTYLINAQRAILQNAKKKRATLDQFFINDQIDVRGTTSNGTIIAKTIKDRSLKPGDLTRRSVGAENIKEEAISSLNFIPDDFITSEKIKNETITNADIANSTITGTKLASDINITTTGNISASNLTISGDIDSLTGTITTLDGITLTYTSGTITSITGTTAAYNTLDLGTNTLTDGNFTGSWSFNSGVLSGISSLSAGAATLLGDLDLGLNQLKNFVLEKLASWPSSPVEGQMFWHTDKDGPYWYTGSRWKSDVSGETFVVAATDSKNKEKADYACDGTADQTEIQAALDALPTGGGKVILMEGTYNITAAITQPANSQLAGIGWSTIINVSGISSESEAISMGNYTLLKDIKIQGDIDPLPSFWRSVTAGNHSVIEHIWINENDYGIETTNKTDVHIRDVYFTQIHDSYGWAACIHSSGTADGIFVEGVYMENADRGFEVEEGVKNFYAKHGYLKTIKVEGTYSFVLDAHTHEGRGGPENIVYEDFYLEDTAGLTVSGYSTTDITKNVTFKNITMVDPEPATGTCALSTTSSENVTFDGVRITGIDFGCVIQAGGDKITLNNIDVVNAQRSGFLASGSSVILQNSRFKNTNPAGDYVLSISQGDNLTIRNVNFYDCKGMGCLQVSSSMSYLTIENCLFELDATSPAYYGLSISTGAPVRIANNKILGNPVLSGISIDTNNVIVTGNYVTGASGGSGVIWVRSGKTDVKIFDNEIASGTPKLTDEGTGTKIYRNKGYITENSGATTVTSGNTSVTVTHGLGATPSINNISVAPTNNMGNATKFWVSDVTSSSFNINVNVDPGATTATFNWQVERY